MPLYSDANYYYSGGSSQLFAPYYPSGVYSIPSVSSAYAPYTSSYSRPLISSSYLPAIPKTPRSPTYSTHGLSSRYQPKLSTIGETSALMTAARHSTLLPLTRTHSPKIKSYSTASSSTLHSKYIPPRPININTADIDVSSARQRRHTDEVVQQPQQQTISEAAEETANETQTDSLNNEVETATANIENTEQTNESKRMRSTIRRNRPVVRLSTVRVRNKVVQQQDTMQPIMQKDQVDGSEEKIGWRQKLADDLALLAPTQTKKSPGQRLRERFLIQDTKSTEEETPKQHKRQSKETEDVMEEVVVEVDAVNQICHVSLPSGPTFHDICADISSDKIDDDLNAGALRKRASIILEQEVELLNQLQQSASGTFQLIHLERRASHDSTIDEPHEVQRASKRLTKGKKKIKHKITAIVDVQNAPLTPILQEREEELSPLQKVSPRQKMSYNLDHVHEHQQIDQVFKLPKRKSVKRAMENKSEGLPEGFVEALPKAKRASKRIKAKGAQVFTFSQKSIDKQKEVDFEVEQKILAETKAETKEEVKELLAETKAETMQAEKAFPVKKVESHLTKIEQKKKILSEKNAETMKIPTPKKALLAQKETKEIKTGENTLKTSNSMGIVQKTNDTSELKTSKSLDSAVLTTKVETKSKEESKIKKEIPKTNKVISKTLKDKSEEKSAEKTKQEQEPSVATPKPIRKVIKADDSEDFWSFIGTRETVYMANRKNILQETLKPRVEMMSEASKVNDTLVKHNLQTNKQQMAHAMDTIQETTLTKVETMQEALKISEPIEKHNLAKQMKETAHKKELATETTLPKVQIMKEPLKLVEQKKVATSESSKSEEIDNKNNATCIMDKIPIPSATTKSHSDTLIPKIQTGKVAKSPEIQQDKLQKTSNEEIKKINTQNTNIATTTKTTTTNTIQPKTSTTKTATTTTPLAAQTKLATKTTKIATQECVAEVENKTSMASECRDDSPLQSNEINKAKTSPINADGFITVAPTNAKKKNASPKKKITPKATTTATTIKESATKLTEKITLTTHDTSTSTNSTLTTTATKMTTSLSTATITIATTVAASNQTEKTVVATTSATAATKTTEAIQATKTTGDNSDGGNNLSKFATVLDLAQCLRDVDADLEDYIPSSADEDNLSDDSTFYCSSVDGCENLSASMKKKIKDKKRKEKKAQQVRFDPQKKIKIDTHNKCYVKDEAPRYPLVATPRPLWKREQIIYPESSDESDSDEESGSTEETEDSEECTSNSEEEYDNSPSSADVTTGSSLASTDNSSIIRMSTCSNDSGFEGGTAPSSPKKMLGECKISTYVCMYVCINM